MPTYVFQCPACDHEFEAFQKKISDRPRTRKCPACGGRAQRRISGGAGFLFKGEGFYATDYRSEEYRKKAEAEKGDKGKRGEKEKKGPKEKKKAGGDGGSSAAASGKNG